MRFFLTDFIYLFGLGIHITMKWHKLLLMIAALAFIVGTFADEIEIPDDIDDEDLDEDEEILRLLEEKRIVSCG